MSDLEDIEFSSGDFDGLDLTNNGNQNSNENKPMANSSDNKNDNDDDFKFPEIPTTKQKNLSIINFSALKPPTGSSITISDATNDSLNVSRPPLLPARLTSISSTPSQNQTSAVEENKPKFDLPPLFNDLDDDDFDEDDQPNLGPIQFPTDLDSKSPNKESREKMDSITINSVSNNTSIFAGANKSVPDSPLKMNNQAEKENNFNNSMDLQFPQNESLSKNENSKSLDNFGFDDIDTPHPLIPSRKRDSSQSLQMNHSASKPSFLNINEIKNIKPGDSFLPTNSECNKNLVSLSTPNSTPPKESNANLPNVDNDVKSDVIPVEDDDINISSVSLSFNSEDGKTNDPKSSPSKSNQSDSKPNQSEKNTTTPSISDNFISIPSSDQKSSQIQMTNDSQSVIPSQAKLQPSPLIASNDNSSNDFFMESDSAQHSVVQHKDETEDNVNNQPVFPTASNTVETFQSTNDNSNNSSQITKGNFTRSSSDSIDQKSTPVNSRSSIKPRSTEGKKLKTELAESAQKVKQSIQQSAKKQNQQLLARKEPVKLQNQLQDQFISPPIINSTESQMNSGSPPNSSSGSFKENENVTKTQTIVNMSKSEEQLSTVSLHLSSDQHVQSQPVKKRVAKMAIEIGVENAFDNASAEFQRLFMNEFAALMRPTFQMPYEADIDNFVDYLSRDINKELSSMTKSYSPNERKIKGISKKIDLLFDEGKDFLNEKLANSYEDELQRKATNYQKLKNLQSLVEDLNKNFSSKITRTMKAIDNYVKDSALIRSNKLMKEQMLQKNLRELTLQRMHLEAKVNKQMSEFELIDRKQNDVILERIAFKNDENLDPDDDRKLMIMKKAAREISLISSNIDRVAFGDLIEIINDAQFQLNSQRMKIREEYSNLDGLAEKMKSLGKKKHSKKSSKKKESSKKKD